jgi:hypothetical protein
MGERRSKSGAICFARDIERTALASGFELTMQKLILRKVKKGVS